jgi:hypothetical protein
MIAIDRTRQPTRRYGGLKIWGAVASARQVWRETPLPTYYLTGTGEELRRQLDAAISDAAVKAGLTPPTGRMVREVGSRAWETGSVQ